MKTTNINSYVESQPLQLEGGLLALVVKKIERAAKGTLRRSHTYERVIRYIRRYYNEGPVNLARLESHLDWEWAQLDGPPIELLSQKATLHKIMERYWSDGRPAQAIDVADFGDEEATASSVSGSAIVNIGSVVNNRNAVVNLRNLIVGSGVEYLGRFYGDNEYIDEEILEISRQFERREAPLEVVEIHYRALRRTHDIMPRRKVFQKRLIILDVFSDDYSGSDYHLRDIDLYIDGNDVCFCHAASGRPLTLTLPNAVNYVQPVHAPIFTFLAACARSRLSYVDLGGLAETMGYMPRLTYGKDLWLRPRTWALSPREISQMKSDPEGAVGFLSEWLKRRIEGNEFELVTGENSLSFRVDDRQGLSLALTDLLAGRAHISESFAEQHPAPSGARMEAIYNHEFVVPFGLHYIAQRTTPSWSERVAERGASESHYPAVDPTLLNFQIFCAKDRIEDILLGNVIQTVRRLKKDNLLEAWFYIRYYQDGPHLRLRLKALDMHSAWRISERMQKLLLLLLADSEILDWRISPFIPEAIRYQDVEQNELLSWFCQDSEQCIEHISQSKLLGAGERINADVRHCAERAHQIFVKSGWTPAEACQLLKLHSGKSGGNDLSRDRETLEQVAGLVASETRISDRPPLAGSTVLSLIHMSANRCMVNWSREREQAALRLLLRCYEIQRNTRHRSD